MCWRLFLFVDKMLNDAVEVVQYLFVLVGGLDKFSLLLLLLGFKTCNGPLLLSYDRGGEVKLQPF